MVKLESKPTYPWRYWSPRQPMWRFSERGDKETIAYKLVIWLLNTTTTYMVSRHYMVNMFAKFPGLSTVNNFAKANRSVCVDQSVG